MAKQKCEEHEKQNGYLKQNNGYPIGCKKGSDPFYYDLLDVADKVYTRDLFGND